MIYVLGTALAFGSAAAWGCGDFLSGLMSRRLPLLTVLLVTQAAGVPLMLLAALLNGPPPDWSFVPLGCLAALGGLTGLGALFRGMAVGTMSLVAPLSATGAAIPVLVGLATGEAPTLAQGAGVLLALIGVMLASRQPSAGGTAPRGALAAGAGYGMIAALGFGAFYVVLRAASAAAGGDPYWPVVAARTTGTIILLAITLVMRPSLSLRPSVTPASNADVPSVPSVRLSRAAHLGTLILAGGLDVAANALYAAASVTDIGPLAAVLSSLFPLTTIALARLFLHERLARSQSLGVLSALAGVALIAWR